MYGAKAISERLEVLLLKSSSRTHPWQTASAIALGCAFGLLPKSTLLFPLALALLFFLPLNLSVATISVLVLSLLAPLIHPIHGAVGGWLLSFESVARWANRLDQMPLVPWLGLHNTVVAGSVTLSAGFLLPTYVVVHHLLLSHYTRRMAEQVQSDFELSMQEKRMAQQSLSLKGTQKSIVKLESKRPRPLAPHVEPKPLASHQPSLSSQSNPSAALAGASRFDASTAGIGPVDSTRLSSQVGNSAHLVDSIHALESLLENTATPQHERMNAEKILERAAQAAELVDDIIHALDSEWIQRSDANYLSETHRAHDTTITIVRKADTGRTADPLVDPKLLSTHPDFSQKDSKILTSHFPVVAPPAPKRSLGTIGENDSLSQALATATSNVEIRHEEALRHLLHHLRSIKEEV